MSDTHADPNQVSPRPTVELRAYEIWLHEGCPDGHDLDHWFQAEAEVASQHAQSEDKGAPPAAGKTKKERAA